VKLSWGLKWLDHELGRTCGLQLQVLVLRCIARCQYWTATFTVAAPEGHAVGEFVWISFGGTARRRAASDLCSAAVLVAEASCAAVLVAQAFRLLMAF
jgi:hypothetical protein